jgi:hypothetical protein
MFEDDWQDSQDRPTPEGQQDLFGGSEFEEPKNPYEVIPSAPKEEYKFGTFLGLDQVEPVVAPTNAKKPEPAEDPAAPTKVHLADYFAKWKPRVRQFLANPTNFYATIFAGLGVLAGLILAAVTWNINNPSGPYDLGALTSDGVGMTGRLFTRWEGKLGYRVSFEPSYPEQLAGFSLAAGNSPRPSSIDIQLMDAKGFVLCSKSILLRYAVRKAAEPSASNPGSANGDAAAGNEANPQPAQATEATEAATIDDREIARERGNDVFQYQFSPSGQVAALTSAGDFPCSRDSYERITSWSFAPDFPTLAEQEEMLKRLNTPPASAPEETVKTYTSTSRRKIASRTVAPAPAFFIEGDDSIAMYDASSGTIETNSNRIFLIDKAGAEANALNQRAADFPLDVHYRCDQNENCVLRSRGVGVLHGRLRK